jgi:diguanylate cyclase (GGDEF)-like protein
LPLQQVVAGKDAMPPAPKPEDEAERLAALRALDILDTPKDPAFDLFPELAGGLLSAPIAAISLVDEKRQWFKAAIGLGLPETPREQAFCAHAILQPDRVLHVPDAAADPRFADNPLVTGELGIRFYAGAPILSPEGKPLGTLCVIDRVPRVATQAQLDQLARLACALGSTLHLHAALRQLDAMAVTDPLTGIANRAGFLAALQAALVPGTPRPRAGRPGHRTALLMLDLDRFKTVNDLFGHAGGDAVLREVARRIRATIRPGDAAGRIGGDEFGVLLRGLDTAEAALAIADRLHAALADGFVLNGKAVPLRTSIGVAVAPDHGADPALLMARADAALFAAKEAGRGTTRLTDAQAPVPAALPTPALGRGDIEAMLRAALLPPGREPFALHFQPFFSAERSLLGFEALVRWPQPDGSLLMPGAFIPVAEATGLIVNLDHWVLQQACAVAARWPQPLVISANLSAANFFAADVVETVEAALARSGLPGARLKLEITETVLLSDPDRVRQAIERLHRLEVRVAIDDFGAGHASLAYLRDYPIDEVKIDRSFLRGIEASPRDRAFLRSIVDLATVLDVATLAEGVETEGQARLLRGCGVGAMQGFLLGRPMPLADALRLIAERRMVA